MTRADSKRALYASWVRDFSADIYRCGYRLCGSGDIAEELSQEVFFEAWRSMSSLRDTQKARCWLLSILRHRYMHWLRDRKRGRTIRGGDRIAADRLVSNESSPHEVLARQESLQLALDALEDHYKVPFLLVFLEGLTCQETAELLEIPLGTVLSRIYRARRLLRRELEDKPSASPHLRIRSGEPDRHQPRNRVGEAP
ncbi:MAG: sigma-70 family RNA polymerase sigma factor [Planctomycetia bacterium]|nr:sigma-70 family RNA polymerase sigma factor [Planctomycetia bacterium]